MELCTYTTVNLELSYTCRESKRTCFYTGQQACRADTSAEISKGPSCSYDTTGRKQRMYAWDWRFSFLEDICLQKVKVN